MNSRTTILAEIYQQMALIKAALDDLLNNSKNPGKTQASLTNIIIWGNGVINSMKNIRQFFDQAEFNKWFEPIAIEIKTDPLLIYFTGAWKDLQDNRELPVRGRLRIKSLDLTKFQKYMVNPPSNAKGFFMVDCFGGSGWEIETASGNIEKFYVEIGEEIMREIKMTPISSVQVSSHKNQKIDNNINEMCRLFYIYLQNVVTSANTVIEK